MSFSHKDLYDKRIQVDFDSKTYYVDGEPTCLHQSRQNEAENCELTAGWGTDHLGTGACKFHGGKYAVPKWKANGRYSSVIKGQLAKKFEEFENDENLLNLMPELVLLRTLAAETIEKYQDDNSSENLQQAIDALTKVFVGVDRIIKRQNEHILTVAQAQLMMVQAVDVQKRLLKKWFGEDHQVK
jgi:hypothetical protein